MDWKMFTYTVYLLLSVVFTFWVARSLYQNGKVFLVSVLEGDKELAGSVNHLLVVGFYLINLGFVSIALRTDAVLPNGTDAIELLSRKLGLVLLVLGVLHLGNLFVLSRMRRRRIQPVSAPHTATNSTPLAPATPPYPAPPQYVPGH